MEDIDKTQLTNRVKELEEQLNGANRIGEVKTIINDTLRDRKTNTVLIKSGQLKVGDNMITGLNGDFVQEYKLVLDFNFVDSYDGGNYVAINNETTDTDMTYIKTLMKYASASASTATTGGTTHSIDFSTASVWSPRYHSELIFNMRKSTTTDDRRLISVHSWFGGNGLSGDIQGTWSVRSTDTLNMTSLNIHINGTIRTGGTYKFYKL